MARKPVLPLLGLSFLLAALACNLPGRVTVSQQGTAAAETARAALSLTPPAAGGAGTPLPGATPLPGISPVPTPTGAPPSATPVEATPTEAGCGTNLAGFVTDVTVPDDSPFQPGVSFTKTWRLRNAGTCPWNSSYALVFDRGDAMSGPPVVQLLGPVAPGATVDLSVNLVAPARPARYTGYWKLRSDTGILFGVGAGGNTSFYVQIVVLGTPTPTGTASLTPTPSSTPTVTATPTPTGTPLPPVNWGSTYSIKIGDTDADMYLVQNDNTVGADIAPGGNSYHLSGVLSADTLTVTGAFSGSGSGTFFWHMAPGGDQFSGNWVEGGLTTAFCGARNGAPLPDPCLGNP
ncbi:MAG: hypothetical protein HY784_08255 [Chloroflexi bacterium]|nr:hypothetical protein [Chloroflexota bacterium]